MSHIAATPAQRTDTDAEPAPYWWAGALTLAERLALATRPAPREGGLAERRLARWRAAHRMDEDGRFEARLADLGIDADTLLALLAEPPEELAARASRPAWADTVEAALATASLDGGAQPAPPEAGEAAFTWDAGFGRIVAPFVRNAVDRVASGAPDGLGQVTALRRGFAEQLGRQLVSLASRVLVLELNVARVRGELHGDSAEERFRSFATRLATREGLAGLLSEYVVLARLLAQCADHAVEAYLELLRRLAADRSAIVAELLGGTDPGRPAEVVMGVGDGHRGGRSVGLLRFESGARVVYKPRSLAVHTHFNRALGWLDDRLPGLGLRALTVLERPGHGWVEYAEHGPCADEAGVRAFYRRQGALLALLYALDGVDFHFENLIAAGDQPVLVDLEALFHPEIPRGGARGPADEDPAGRALDTSVARVGLLPAVVWSKDGGALDMGGMGGDAGSTLPFESAGWAGAGTDEMRLIRERAAFPGSSNRPGVGDAVADPADHVEDFLAGFTSAYEAIAAHRDELLSPGGILAAFQGDEIRVVMRPTQLYGTLLLESTHPDVMRDALDRDHVLDALWAACADDPVRRRLVPAEIADVWNGDIPLFSGRPGTPDLWTSRDERLAGALTGVPSSDAAAKIRAMGPRDLAEQQWIIRASLASRRDRDRVWTSAAPAAPAGPTPPADELADRLVAMATAIGDELAERAHRDASAANWLGMELVGETRWTVGTLKSDLYGGTPGVALFLGQLARITGEHRHADLAMRALSWVPGFVDGIAAGVAALPCGPFNSAVGLAYALTHLARDLGAPDLLGHVEPLIAATTGGAAADEGLDIVSGAAGCLAAMLAVHEATGLPDALEVARACADRLVETARPQDGGVAWHGHIPASMPLTGFSHGTAGIGWALLRFAARTGEAQYAETGLAAFAYERSRFDARIGNWPDFRDLPDTPAPPSGLPPSMQAWCHGAPGIGLARADLLHRRPGLSTEAAGDLAADLDVALRSYLGSPPGVVGHSLCHGEAGNLELLTHAVAAGRHDLADALRVRTGVLLAQLADGPRCGTPGGVTTPGLMSGLAGIGHGLLRLAAPAEVPSVLLLAPPAA
ncbi:type 2 lanthipeptide synthetase LanM family protein [Nonomuraea jabiensis]|uniref:type 2 lanthipeptide synthetase LanM family protein n=1 Tax=Nonomuraea jabiensis TaxID=882448 RepID=UPI003D72706F